MQHIKRGIPVKIGSLLFSLNDERQDHLRTVPNGVKCVGMQELKEIDSAEHFIHDSDRLVLCLY